MARNLDISYCEVRVGYMGNKRFLTKTVEFPMLGSEPNEIAADELNYNKPGLMRFLELPDLDILDVKIIRFMSKTVW